MSVATAASMDGYTAFGASITFQGAKQTFNCPAPRAVVADIDIIRRTPPEMTASDYADLSAKLTAGADWILADALGVEPIDSRAWAIVQSGLRDSLADPAGARAGTPSAITPLVEDGSPGWSVRRARAHRRSDRGGCETFFVTSGSDRRRHRGVWRPPGAESRWPFREKRFIQLLIVRLGSQAE
jgi:hypothetical protein